MDELERMAMDAERFDRQNLDKKKTELMEEIKDYEFRTLLDAVELLFELRAKREKNIKDQELINIIEGILKEEPFEYMDEDFILAAYKNRQVDIYKFKKKKW